MTILIGKNSSGKSAVAKLPTLIEGSLSGAFPEPFQLENDGVELGGELKDLVYGRLYGSLEFELEENNDKLKLTITIFNDSGTDTAKIMEWDFNSEDNILYDNTKDVYVSVASVEKPDAFWGFWWKPPQIYGSVEFILSKNLACPFNLNVDYFAPFRVIPKRGVEMKKQKIFKVGVDGEKAYQLLVQDAITTTKPLISDVSNWYKQNFEGWEIHVNQDKKPFYQVEMKRNDIAVNIRDVGQGMSQALPLVVRAFVPDEQDTLIIMEQPELHLHPAAHGNLAELFAQSTIDNPHKRYLIETHSQNFVLRLRRMIAEQRFNKDNLAIYYVDFDENNIESTLKRINVDDWGQVDFWPKNVFNETLEETSAIRTSQLNRKEI